MRSISYYQVYDSQDDNMVFRFQRQNNQTNQFEDKIVFVKIGNGGLPEHLHQLLFNECKILKELVKPTVTRCYNGVLYFGIWKRYMSSANWTGDSHRDDKQKKDVDNFLLSCAPAFKYICGILKSRFLEIYNQYTESYSNIDTRLSDNIMKSFAPYKTMSINLNRAVSIYKDWDGDINGIECIAVAGDWENGGDLVLEDLNAIIKIRPGDIYLLNSANIFHHVIPYTKGSRFSIILFNDKAMI